MFWVLVLEVHHNKNPAFLPCILLQCYGNSSILFDLPRNHRSRRVHMLQWKFPDNNNQVAIMKTVRADEKMSYQYDKLFAFHYITESNITYLCMSADDINGGFLSYSWMIWSSDFNPHLVMLAQLPTLNSCKKLTATEVSLLGILESIVGSILSPLHFATSRMR